MNIVEAICRQMGYEPLPKIDPNNQQPENNAAHTLPQAVIPAVLTGIYSATRTDEGLANYLNNKESRDWGTVIFGDGKAHVIDEICRYAGVDQSTAANKIQEVATVAHHIIVSNEDSDTVPELKVFLDYQRTNILEHLPPQLEMGKILNDTTLDDRTNKMEGPISTLMHKIEEAFK